MVTTMITSWLHSARTKHSLTLRNSSMLRKEAKFLSPSRWPTLSQNYPHPRLTKRFKRRVPRGNLKTRLPYPTLCSIERCQGMEMCRIYKWFSSRCKELTCHLTTPLEPHSVALKNLTLRLALRALRTRDRRIRECPVMATLHWSQGSRLRPMTRWSTQLMDITYHLLPSRIITELY